MNSHVDDDHHGDTMVVSRWPIKLVHHCVAAGSSPVAAYLGISALREGKSTLAVLAGTRSGTPVGEDWKTE